MKIQKKYHTSIFLLIIGLLIAKTRILFGDGCWGMADGLMTLVLILFYTISFIIIIATSESSLLPSITTLVVIILVAIVSNAEKFESATILSAVDEGDSSLTLRENNTFTIQQQAIEWSCYYNGSYAISGDTLVLLRSDILLKTDSLFVSKYLIDRQGGILLPLENVRAFDERARIRQLRIRY